MITKKITVNGIVLPGAPEKIALEHLNKHPRTVAVLVAADNGKELFFRKSKTVRESTEKEWETYWTN